MLRLFGLLLLGGLIAITFGAIAGMRRLTQPRRRTYASQVRMNLPGDPSELDTPRAFEELTIPTSLGSLSAWRIEGDSAKNDDAPDVVFLHGWASSKHAVLHRLGAYAPNARRVVAIDLPGHGESEGRCHLAVREPGAVIEAIEYLDLPVDKVVIAGSSMGAATAIGVAACARVRALVAEAPYREVVTPVRNTIRRHGKPWYVTGQLALALSGIRSGGGPTLAGFDRAGHMERVLCPALIVHGTNDETCPIQDGRDIAGASEHTTFVEIEGAGHSDLHLEEHREHTTEAILRFLANV